MPRMLLGALALLAVVCSGQAEAQTAPSPAELAAYRGLHAAAVTGNAAAIRQLAAAGSDFDARDGNGRTPLHVAAFQGRAEAARLLIASGAKPGLLDDQRYDAVTIAAVRDDVPMVKALLASGSSAKLITSRYDGTALIAAAHLGHDRVVRALIEAGAPLDHINNLGWTALMESVVLGDGRATPCRDGPCSARRGSRSLHRGRAGRHAAAARQGARLSGHGRSAGKAGRTLKPRGSKTRDQACRCRHARPPVLISLHRDRPAPTIRHGTPPAASPFRQAAGEVSTCLRERWNCAVRTSASLRRDMNDARIPTGTDMSSRCGLTQTGSRALPSSTEHRLRASMARRSRRRAERACAAARTLPLRIGLER